MSASERIDPAETDRFAAMAARWWDPDGPMKPLHRQGPARMRLIRDEAARRFDRDSRAPRPLAGLRAADIGCGGGLIAEPLARMGAEVVGIDPTVEAIEAARAHADRQGLSIDYRIGAADDLAGETFDIVTAMEVIEHAPDPRRFADSCAALVAPGGVFIGSTLNRTLKSLALAKVGAEYVLRWLPVGTHDWRKFVRPAEFGGFLRAAGLTPTRTAGIVFNPLARRWDLSDRDLDVDYAIIAEAAR